MTNWHTFASAHWLTLIERTGWMTDWCRSLITYGVFSSYLDHLVIFSRRKQSRLQHRKSHHLPPREPSPAKRWVEHDSWFVGWSLPSGRDKHAFWRPGDYLGEAVWTQRVLPWQLHLGTHRHANADEEWKRRQESGKEIGRQSYWPGNSW